jgi:hypothetical protein
MLNIDGITWAYLSRVIRSEEVHDAAREEREVASEAQKHGAHPQRVKPAALRVRECRNEDAVDG